MVLVYEWELMTGIIGLLVLISHLLGTRRCESNPSHYEERLPTKFRNMQDQLSDGCMVETDGKLKWSQFVTVGLPLTSNRCSCGTCGCRCWGLDAGLTKNWPTECVRNLSENMPENRTKNETANNDSHYQGFFASAPRGFVCDMFFLLS